MILPILAIVISALALTLSGFTAYLTLVRRGTVKMTRPTQIYFGPDKPQSLTDKPPPRIIIRSLLFATSKRGRVIENIYIRLRRDETYQNFSIWTYGYEKPVLAGGLFVGETGVEAYHYFLTHDEGKPFTFDSGVYQIEIFAQVLGDKTRRLLFSDSIKLSQEIASQIENPWKGVYFDWDVYSGRYIPHLETKPPNISTLFPKL